jgi:hypothetical protein
MKPGSQVYKSQIYGDYILDSLRYDERFRRFTPAQFGEWYDQERGRKEVKTTAKTKGAKY